MKTGTREWSEHSVNIQVGCPNNCRYCYAREMAVRFKRCAPDKWDKPVETALPEIKRRPGTTMFPTTHDITKDNWERCAEAIKRLLAGMEDDDRLLIVTKPDFGSTLQLANALQDQPRVEWRVTIGSLDEQTIKFWEPGAPSAETRLGLIYFLRRLMGYKVSVSIEPYLDMHWDDVVKAVYPHASEIWVGRMNNINRRVNLEEIREEDRWRIHEIQTITSDSYIKKVLVPGLYGYDKIQWKDSIKKVMGWIS